MTSENTAESNQAFSPLPRIPENPADLLAAAVREHVRPLTALLEMLNGTLHPAPYETEQELAEVREELETAEEKVSEYEDTAREVIDEINEADGAIDEAVEALGEDDEPADRAAVLEALQRARNSLTTASRSLSDMV